MFSSCFFNPDKRKDCVRVVQYDEEDNLGEIYQRPWDDPETDTITVKLRYRFWYKIKRP